MVRILSMASALAAAAVQSTTVRSPYYTRTTAVDVFSLSRLKLVEAIQLLEDSRDPFQLPSPRPTGLLFVSGFLEAQPIIE